MSFAAPPPSPPAEVRPDRSADLDTAILFAGRTEVIIRHAGADYRLRITRAGKLILTK